MTVLPAARPPPPNLPTDILAPAPGRTAPDGEDSQVNSTDAFDAPASTLTPFHSDIQSLKKGIVKTSKDPATPPYTILLVVEAGVGKSSVLELIANVLAGNDISHYDFNGLEHTNKQGDSGNQSRTNSARLYEIRSKNVSAGVCDCDRREHA